MGPRQVKEDADRNHVRALARGLEILRCLTEFGVHGATLSQVAEVVGLDRATSRRLLLTLTDLGYVRTSGKQFFASPRSLELGYAYFASMPIWERIQPILAEFSDKHMGAVSIGVLDGRDVVYVARAQNRRSVYTLNVGVGSRFPIYSSSTGRVLLSGLRDDEIKSILKQIEIIKRTPKTRMKTSDIMAEIAAARSAGYCICDEETEMGVRSIAVPIRDRQHNVVAAMNASVQATIADSRALLHHYLPPLRVAVAQVQAAFLIDGAASIGRSD